MSSVTTGGNGRGGLVEAVGLWESGWAKFWQDAVPIAENQGKVVENWAPWLPRPFVLAPAQLWQDVLRAWNFGNQVNVYQSQDPEAERRIVTERAGYGSQLGTVQDYLKVIQKQLQNKALDDEDREAERKFNELVEYVKSVTRRSSTGKVPRGPGR